MQLTPQQQAALSARKVSVALSAGAGCGKTFVLTQRFLREIESRRSADVLSRIVAITFTERAAREMRDRIRKACEAKLEASDSDEASYWLAVLRSIDTARISTIHAFCATLLRTYAVEAELDPNFAVLEESDSRALRRRAVTAALHDLLSAHDEDCMQLVLDYGLERTASLMQELASGSIHVGPPIPPLGKGGLGGVTTAEDRAADWRSRWKSEFVPMLLRDIQDSPAAKRVLELLDEHVPGHDVMRERCETLKDVLPKLAEADDPVTTLQNCRAATMVQGGGGKKAWSSEEVYADVSESLKKLRGEIDKATKNLDVSEDDVRTAAAGSVRAERVARAVIAEYQKRKAALGMLDFDDLLLKTRDLLRDHPAVRQSAAAGIEFLMVDEFQDTDPVQADVVRSLCGEGVLTGKLFLVGDVKQSIYRFRRADPRVFIALREEIPEPGRLPLSRNFRSQPAILNFVNCLFAPAMGNDYEPLEPHVEQLSPTPAIEFLFATPPPDDHTAGDSAEDRRRREADWMAKRLRQLLDDETPRIRAEDPVTGEVTLRRVQPGDVAILFRALSNVHLYEEALREHGVAYYLVGGRAFFAQQEVYDVMNLLTYLDEPDDAVALAGILRSPMFGLTDETLLALVEERQSLCEAIVQPRAKDIEPDQQSLLNFAVDLLAELRGRKDRMPLADLLEFFVEQTGYDAILLTEFLGRRKLANLQKLIETARGFDRSGLMTVSEFVERLRESVAEQTHEEVAATHPETSDVVRLMTIHQSKGLEFPVVLIADMDWSRNQTGGVTFHETLGPLLPMPTVRGERKKNIGQIMHRLEEQTEDELERLRLLYVATTRAADYLVLSAGLPATGRASSPWLKLVAERFDLQTGLPAVDPYLGKLSLGDVPREKIPDIHVHHEPPQIDDSKAKSERPLPLSQFREMLETAEPAALPATLYPVKSPASQRLEINVTDLLQADRALRKPHARPLVEDDEPTDTGGDARQLGTLIHVALERLDGQTADDIPALIDATVESMSFPVSDAMRETAERRVWAFVASPIHAEINTAKQCFRELDFVYRLRDADPEVIVTGQIDCLYQSNNSEWTLIDFKTGQPHAENPAEILDDYLVQLAVYTAAAEVALGCSMANIGIIHVHDEITRFDLQKTEQDRAEWQQRVNAAVEKINADFDMQKD